MNSLTYFVAKSKKLALACSITFYFAVYDLFLILFFSHPHAFNRFDSEIDQDFLHKMFPLIVFSYILGFVSLSGTFTHPHTTTENNNKSSVFNHQQLFRNLAQ